MARPSDRIEALILAVLVAAGLALIGVGIWTGHALANGLDKHGPRPHSGEYAAPAVAVGEAQAISGVGVGTGSLWSVPVTWATPLGAPAQGRVLVDRQVRPGELVPVVVDAAGRARADGLAGLAAAPFVAGVVTVLAGWLMLASLWLLTDSVLARRHASVLDAEWKRVEPLWSGRER